MTEKTCATCKRTQPDWMRTLRRGDVLRGDSSRTPRIVRKVSTNPCGCLWGVTFVIQRCSWTRRCYTVVNYSDMKQRKFRPVGHRWRFRGAMDPLIDRAIQQPCWEPYAATCCDVEGLA